MRCEGLLIAAVLLCGVCSIALAQENLSTEELRIPKRGSPEAAKSPPPPIGSLLLEEISPKSALLAIEKLRPPKLTRGAKEQKIFREAAPAVVLIVTNEGIGSGSLLRDRNILTNAHVVGSDKQVSVVFYCAGTRQPNASDVIVGDVLRVDEVKDLALVHPASVPANAKTLDIDATDALEVGADVHAIGHPTGQFCTYTKGIISQIRPDYVWDTDCITHKATVIQTQTPINPGNSGGPLISDDGKLVGVNSFRYQGEGLNYAVAAKEVRAFLAATQSVIAPRAEPKLLFEGRTADNTGFMRQYSLRCDNTVDLILVEPDDTQKPFYALADTKRRGKPDVLVLARGREYYWEKSYWDVDSDETFALEGFHRNGEWQPYEFKNRCPGKALTDFKCA